MPLVSNPATVQFVQMLGIETGRKAMLGDWDDLPPVPAGALMKVHHAVGDAVRRVNSLDFDKSRNEVQKHHAAKQVSTATVAEIQKARATLKEWADLETAAGMAAIAKALEPDMGTAAQVVRSEIRAFVRSSLTGDKAADFAMQLRGLVETDKRFADALFEAPAALSGLTPDRLSVLRGHAAAVYAPEAMERVHKAQDVAALDAKLAKVEADIPRSFYNPTVEAGMNSRVDDDAPLRTE